MNDAQLGIQTGIELSQLLKDDDLGGFIMLQNNFSCNNVIINFYFREQLGQGQKMSKGQL